MKYVFEMEGGKELRKALLKLKEETFEALIRPVNAEAKKLLADSVFAAPSESGELVASAKVVASVNRKRGGIKAHALYEDDKAPAVHEGIHWNHKTKEPTQGFKWFERAFNEFEPGFYQRIIAVLRGVVNGGGK